jgi:hypothetical protein
LLSVSNDGSPTAWFALLEGWLAVVDVLHFRRGALSRRRRLGVGGCGQTA